MSPEQAQASPLHLGDGSWQPWVNAVVSAWRYPREDQHWFLDQLARVPAGATVAGGFATSLFDQLAKAGGDVDACLAWLRFERMPSAFRSMRLEHYLLAAGEVIHRLGDKPRFVDDVHMIRDAVQRAMFSALIRRTLPGLQGQARLEEMLRLIARAFSGVLFSHAQISLRQHGDGWVLEHRNDYNFLGQFHYPDAYYRLTGGDDGPVARVWVQELGGASRDIFFDVR